MRATFVCDSCDDQIDIEFVTPQDSLQINPHCIDARCECGGSMHPLPNGYAAMARMPVAKAVEVPVRITW